MKLQRSCHHLTFTVTAVGRRCFQSSKRKAKITADQKGRVQSPWKCLGYSYAKRSIFKKTAVSRFCTGVCCFRHRKVERDALLTARCEDKYLPTRALYAHIPTRSLVAVCCCFKSTGSLQLHVPCDTSPHARCTWRVFQLNVVEAQELEETGNAFGSPLVK